MNKISVLPEEIGFCSRLSELDLSANAIDSLPTSLAMCNQMVILNVAMNKISDIPTDIFSLLVQLRELQLYKNKLTELPPEIGNLKGDTLCCIHFVLQNMCDCVEHYLKGCITCTMLYIYIYIYALSFSTHALTRVTLHSLPHSLPPP